jgi:hypothetical protein
MGAIIKLAPFRTKLVSGFARLDFLRDELQILLAMS